jgi:uncharacterized protein (TIGR02466 family)
MNFSLAGVDTLFPIQLFRYRVDDPTLNDRLSKEIAARRKAEEGMTNTNRLGWQSAHDLFRRTESGHVSLARYIGQVVGATLQSLDPAVDLEKLQVTMNGWINVNPPGGYNGPHQHTDALLSGVYYVDVPRGRSEAGGAIEFLSPHPVRLLGGLMKGSMFTERVRYQPRAGDMFVFPGQLPHWVHPNDSGKARVTIAFNAAVRPAAAAARPRS